MIKSKMDFKICVMADSEYYKAKSKKDKFVEFITNDSTRQIWRFIKLLRKTEYYYNTKHNLFGDLMYLYYRNRKNTLGTKLGIKMWENTFDKGLIIFHSGNIVINGKTRIGKNCKLHGSNCIGNNGFSDKAPILGNNIDIGVGAKIIGDVYLADDIIIGANAVVVDSFYEKGITIAGVPAKRIK